MNETGDYRADLIVLLRWIDQAMARGGTQTEVPGRVATHILTAIRSRPKSLISGVPNRVPGRTIYWYADVDHDRRRVTITHIEPEPHPGL